MKKFFLGLSVVVIVLLFKERYYPHGLMPRYDAEVGYCKSPPRDKPGWCEDAEIRWELWGDFTDLSECKSAAIARYNYYWSKGLAFSWACQLKNGRGGYASRHR